MSDYKPEYVKKDDFIAEKRWLYCEHCVHRQGKKRGKQTVLYEIGEAPCKACGINDMLEEIEDFPAADVREVKWISVKDRLPKGGDESGEICENVCLLMDDGMVTCGWMNGITKRVYFLNARDDFIIKAPITRVTHWMPLPQPPKEE